MKTLLLSFLGTLLALIVLVVLVGGGVAIKASQKPKIEDRSWLVIDLYGEILEYNPPGGVMGKITGGEPETLHRILGNLEKAHHDERIVGVILKIASNGAGLAGMQEIRGELQKLREAGKRIYGWSDSISMRHYYLAAACDEFYLAPQADVTFTGIAVTSTHLRGALEKLGIKPNLHKIKDYKAAAELIMRDDMSPAAKENRQWMLDEIWEMVFADISTDRGLSEEDLTAAMERAVFSAAEAVERGLADELLYWDELEDRLKQEDDDELRTVSQSRYAQVERKKLDLDGDAKIAIVHAQGSIGGRETRVDPLFGLMMGHESVVSDLRRAREDEDIAAIVFRVDSGGGESLASDLIAHEVARCAAEKPIICSMVNVAASGGYYIAYPATRVLGDPMTITGSIGSITAKFNTKGLRDKLGITQDSVTKGPMALFWSSDRDFTEEEWARFTDEHWRSFNDWLADVAEKRGLSFEEAEKLAHGRVWTGRQAVANGLLDEQGGLDRAVALAKELAEIPADDGVELVHYPEEKDFIAEILGGDFSAAVDWAVYRLIREDLAETWNLLLRQAALQEVTAP